MLLLKTIEVKSGKKLINSALIAIKSLLTRLSISFIKKKDYI